MVPVLLYPAPGNRSPSHHGCLDRILVRSFGGRDQSADPGSAAGTGSSGLGSPSCGQAGGPASSSSNPRPSSPGTGKASSSRRSVASLTPPHIVPDRRLALSYVTGHRSQGRNLYALRYSLHTSQSAITMSGRITSSLPTCPLLSLKRAVDRTSAATWPAWKIRAAEA
jgi:hypothetical protein